MANGIAVLSTEKAETMTSKRFDIKSMLLIKYLACHLILVVVCGCIIN